MRNMAKDDVTVISERSEMMGIPDPGEYLLDAVLERLQTMTDSELEALFAGLPGNSMGPGRAYPDLDRIVETLWCMFHVHQNVLDD